MFTDVIRATARRYSKGKIAFVNHCKVYRYYDGLVSCFLVCLTSQLRANNTRHGSAVAVFVLPHRGGVVWSNLPSHLVTVY